MICEHLPSLNALWNSLATVCLIFGWRAIRTKRETLHRTCMLLAVFCSTAFLIGYLTYHYYAGVTRYQGEGIWRGIYFFILGTHTPLAAGIVPFVVMALVHAFRKDFKRHTRITQWLLPVWLYVSVTGVLIYLMLYWK